MNKSNSNMEALSQQIKRNNRWRRAGLIALLGILGTSGVVELIRHFNTIGELSELVVKAIVSLLTDPLIRILINLLAAFATLFVAFISFCICIETMESRSKFFNHTAVEWGREWLLESHDFRNDKEAHQLFRKMAIQYSILETILATLFFNGVFYGMIVLSNNNSDTTFLSLKTTLYNFVLSFGLAFLFKLLATIWHLFFQYQLKEYPQAFINKYVFNVYPLKLAPVHNCASSSWVPLTVVWSILQMPPKRNEKEE